MDGLLLVYALVVSLELVLSLVMLGVLLLSIAPRGAAGENNVGVELVSTRQERATASRVGSFDFAQDGSTPTGTSHPDSPNGYRDDERFPEDLDRSLRLAFRELSRGSRDVALMVHTRSLLERQRRMEGAAGERA